MRIKNVTDSFRYCWNRKNGRQILVAPGEIVDLDKIRFDTKAFKIIRKDEKTEKQSTSIPGKVIKRRQEKKWQR